MTEEIYGDSKIQQVETEPEVEAYRGPSATAGQSEVVPAPNSISAGNRAVSARKQAANRANSLKSTGPRTALGKSHSRGNSTTHGMLARETLFTPDGRVKDPELMNFHQRIVEENDCDDLYSEFLAEDTTIAYAGYHKALVLEGKSEAKGEWYPVRDSQLQRYLNGHRRTLHHNFKELRRRKIERFEPEEQVTEPKQQELANPGYQEQLGYRQVANMDAASFAHEMPPDDHIPEPDMLDEPANEYCDSYDRDDELLTPEQQDPDRTDSQIPFDFDVPPAEDTAGAFLPGTVEAVSEPSLAERPSPAESNPVETKTEKGRGNSSCGTEVVAPTEPHEPLHPTGDASSTAGGGDLPSPAHVVSGSVGVTAQPEPPDAPPSDSARIPAHAEPEQSEQREDIA